MSSRSTSVSQTTMKDYRADLAGAVAGQIAGPGAVAVQPGGVGAAAGDYSTISTTISGMKVGMTGAEVKDLVTQTADAFKGATTGVLDFARSSIASTQAAQTGGLGDVQKYVPLVIVGLVVVAIWRARK